MRKLLSVVLAITMAALFTAPVFAEGGKVNNPGTYGSPSPPKGR